MSHPISFSPTASNLQNGTNNTADLAEQAEKLITFLLEDKEDKQAQPLFTGHFKTMLKAVFVEKNKEALTALKTELKKRLTEICGSSLLNDDRKELQIGSLLSLFAYFNPEEPEKVTIPVKINEQWQNIEYSITRIKISTDEILSPVYAFGLKPEEQTSQAKPILLFRGTPHFQDSGFFSAVAADLPLPWNEVGENLFEKGKDEITTWLTNNEITHFDVYGHSLGGTLALHAGAAWEGKARIFAYNPAGFMHLKETFKNISGKVFWHNGDPISKVGRFPEGSSLEYYRVQGAARNPLNAHSKAMGFNRGTTLEKVTITEENKKIYRWVLPVLHRIGVFLGLPLIKLFAKIIAVGKLIVSGDRKDLMKHYFSVKKDQAQDRVKIAKKHLDYFFSKSTEKAVTV